MSAEKGNNYNPKGRPIGAKSVKTMQWEQFAEYCMQDGLEKFSIELNKLEKKEYVNAFLSLLDYFKPKLSRTDQQFNLKSDFSLTKLLDEVNKK